MSYEEGLTALLEYLGCRRIKVEVTDSEFGDKIRCTCPWHEDTNPSFMVRTQPPFWTNCFVCGKGMGLPQMVMRSYILDDVKFGEALRIVRKFVDIDNKKLILRKSTRKRRLPILPETYLAPYQARLNVAYGYMAGRGFSKRFCVENEVCYDSREDRVVIPIRNEDGYLVAFQGRSLDPDEEAKYKFYYKVRREFTLLGVHDYTPGDPWKVVEGPLDYLRLKSYGATNVVALCGSKMSLVQGDILSQFPEPFWLMLDKDQAGLEGTEAIIKRFKDKRTLKVVDWQDHHSDPGALSRREYEELNMLPLWATHTLQQYT